MEKFAKIILEKMSHFASIYDERDAFFGILQVLIFPVLLFRSTNCIERQESFSAAIRLL